MMNRAAAIPNTDSISRVESNSPKKHRTSATPKMIKPKNQPRPDAILPTSERTK